MRKSDKRENLQAELEGIRHLLSHLHGEVTALEQSYAQVLGVLRRFQNVCDIDELTGLKRRSAFFQKWETLMEECRRVDDDCGLLMVDIDHFKRINDTHGHPTGDEVIQKVASMLKQYESPNCVVGRYGGEEFAVAVRGTDAEILGIAEMVRRGAEKLHGDAPSGVAWKCTISVGMASARKAGFDAPRLLKAADMALYEAKNKGRNQVRAAA